MPRPMPYAVVCLKKALARAASIDVRVAGRRAQRPAQVGAVHHRTHAHGVSPAASPTRAAPAEIGIPCVAGYPEDHIVRLWPRPAPRCTLFPYTTLFRSDCVTIDVLPRTPGNNVYVGFMVWSNFT